MNRGSLCLSLSAVLYGILPTLSAAAYRGGINGVTLTFLRSIISLPVMYAIIRADKRSMKLNMRQLRQMLLLGSVGGTLPILFLYLSYQYISTALAASLHFIYPLLVVLATAVIWRRRLSRVVLTAVMLVTVGIFMFTDISRSSEVIGIVFALLSGIFYSFYVIYLEHSGLDRLDYVVLTFYTMAVMSVSMFVFGLLSGSLYFNITPMAWSLSAVISLVVALGAMPLFQVGVSYAGAAQAGILSGLEPVTSVILGAVLLGEGIGMGQMMGAGMIIFGVLISQRGRTEPLQLAESAVE